MMELEVQTHVCLALKPFLLHQTVINNEKILIIIINYQKEKEIIYIDRLLFFAKYLLTMGK